VFALISTLQTTELRIKVHCLPYVTPAATVTSQRTRGPFH